MATSVNGAFDAFLKETIDIAKNDSDKAKSSRDYLLSQISYISSSGDFINLAPQDNCFFGSFSRKTKICVLDDIDIIIGLDGRDLIVEGNQWDNISIKLKNVSSNAILKSLSDKFIMNWQPIAYLLNSNKVKNKLVSELSKISQYEKAEIHARGEAVTLKLKSYTWNFDIVPAFYFEGDQNNKPYYLIPNGYGKWKKTNPKIEQKRISDTNRKFNNVVYKTIRLIKYWNKRGQMPNITSYVLETMALDYFDSAQHYCTKEDGTTVDYPDIHFRDALNYISSHICETVLDSKGIQGNINNLSYQEKIKIYQRAKTDYEKAKKATYAEINEKDNKKSINIWRDIFGGAFPKYE